MVLKQWSLLTRFVNRRIQAYYSNAKLRGTHNNWTAVNHHAREGSMEWLRKVAARNPCKQALDFVQASVNLRQTYNQDWCLLRLTPTTITNGYYRIKVHTLILIAGFAAQQYKPGIKGGMRRERWRLHWSAGWQTYVLGRRHLEQTPEWQRSLSLQRSG